MSDSLRSHGLYSPWNSPGKITTVSSHSLLHGIFPTQGLNKGLLHCSQILYVLSPCCPKDSQESSPAPQFKGISSAVLRFLYGPALTFIHDYWENHNFDYMDLCWQMMSLLFNMMSRFVIDFLPGSKCLLILWLQSQYRLSLLNLSDLGAQENKICHCSYIFPIYSL